MLRWAGHSENELPSVIHPAGLSLSLQRQWYLHDTSHVRRTEHRSHHRHLSGGTQQVPQTQTDIRCDI